MDRLRVESMAPVRWARAFFSQAPAVLASAVAFNLFFALVPTLVALLSTASLIGRSENTIEQAASSFEDVLPRSVVDFILGDEGLLPEVAGYLDTSTWWVVALTLLIALFSGARGSLTVVQALVQIEEGEESRPWWRVRLVGMGLTLGFAVTLLVGSIVLVAGGSIVEALAEGVPWLDAAALIGIPAAGLLVFGFLEVLYRFGPPIPLPGSGLAAVLATLGILATSLAMRWVFGVLPRPASLALLGGVAILLLWLYLVSWVMLVSASVAASVARRRTDS
ncbi:MAG: YihY/virulence factor BrkB family protein [Acidimicrobiia bacterium]|nr:YihY/virulence factor BrkB family protein [Acidimicrobiia bacterium]